MMDTIAVILCILVFAVAGSIPGGSTGHLYCPTSNHTEIPYAAPTNTPYAHYYIPVTPLPERVRI